MRRFDAMLIVVAIVAAGCTGDRADAPGDASEAATTTTQAAGFTTTTGVTVTSAGAQTTTTPARAGDTATTTGAPSVTGAELACPDLYGEVDDPERSDGMLEAWALPDAAAMWQVPLGSRIPAWAVWSDEVILGFPDGELVALESATCALQWAITVQGGIRDLAVTGQGLIITVNDSAISAFSGPGFGTWRHDAEGSAYAFAGENNGIHVFVDQFGDLVGIDTGGDVVFEWGGASSSLAVAVSESFVYRATGAEVAARPAAGGDLVWARALPGVTALFSVPGLLIAQDETSLHALHPGDGTVRWSVPFSGDVAGPLVLDHGEVHVSARHETLGFDTMWHLDPADGSPILEALAPAGTEWFPEMDDALVLQVGDDGTVTAVDLLQRSLWSIETGADRIDRFTAAEVGPGGVIVTLSYGAERF